MRRVGSSSWRFVHGVEQLPHALLYVRDALRLQVESALGVPPLLREVPPDRSGLLDPSARTDAARDWATWWTTLLKFEAQRHFLGADELREYVVDYDRAVDPKTATSLAGTTLEAAAVTLFGEALNWAGRLPADLPSPRDLTSREEAFAWLVVRDTAEAVAIAEGVDAGAIDGAATVLIVEGEWWDLVTPSFALCSLAAATNSDMAGAILRSVFESGLAAA